jgi:AIPR protein
MVTLPVKVIEADERSIFDEVVEATNSQTQVTRSQLYAIKEEVRRLQQFFDAYPISDDQERRLYFERRTEEYFDLEIPAIRIFDLHMLAKVYSAMFLDSPHLASGYPNQIYEEKRDNLFKRTDNEVMYYTAAFSYYRLNLLLGNSTLDRRAGLLKWHILMVMKYQIAGRQPQVNAKKKMQKY